MLFYVHFVFRGTASWFLATVAGSTAPPLPHDVSLSADVIPPCSKSLADEACGWCISERTLSSASRLPGDDRFEGEAAPSGWCSRNTLPLSP
jgi:hypothetical protein